MPHAALDPTGNGGSLSGLHAETMVKGAQGAKNGSAGSASCVEGQCHRDWLGGGQGAEEGS